MKPTYVGPLIALTVLLVVLFSQSFYQVDESEQVIITQFGQSIGGAIMTPGLKWRIPFIHQVNRFEKRILEWDGDPERMPSKDKKYLWVDATARWRIVDPLKFLQTVGSEMGAQKRLDDILDGTTRSAVANHDLMNVVRSSNRILTAKVAEDIDFEVDYPEIKDGRTHLTEEIMNRSLPLVREYGIELIGLRIKRINYEPEVRKKVYERMISERKRVSGKLRSEGQGESAEIQGRKEKMLRQIESEAYRSAQAVIGEAEAKALKIYADAYSADPEFYTFYKTLESYATSVKDTDRLILTTDNEFLHYLEHSQ
ncbi:MAG: protease modulator HflC [Candidatus Omnitrophica bacterium]|nr:protease modulator HflC [Candidatus Omnitrophota bacterium]